MRTDDFIRALSRDGVIEAPSGARRGLVLAILCALAVGTAFLGAIGPRANILQSIGPVAWKIVITGLVGVGGFVLTGRLGRPGATAGRAYVVLAAAVALLCLWLAWTMLREPGSVLSGVFGESALHCLIAIPVMSLPTLAMLTLAARRAAVTRPDLAGVAAGLAAAGFAAVFYALNCTGDSPLFIALWYSIATAIVCALGIAAFRRFVRW